MNFQSETVNVFGSNTISLDYLITYIYTKGQNEEIQRYVGVWRLDIYNQTRVVIDGSLKGSRGNTHKETSKRQTETYEDHRPTSRMKPSLFIPTVLFNS